MDVVVCGLLRSFYSEVLQDRTVSNHRFSWKIRTKMALDIARGMFFMHTNPKPPIIHRDLRSPNIFVVSLNYEDENEVPITINKHQQQHNVKQRTYTNFE